MAPFPPRPCRGRRRTAVRPVTFRLLAAVCVCGAALTPAGTAQAAPRAGFAANEVFRDRNSPTGFGGFAVGATGDELYYAIDHVVYRRDDQGVPHLVRALATGTRPGLLVRPAAQRRVYYTDPAAGLLYAHDVDTGVETAQPVPQHAFDLDVTGSGDILVSANPRWPQPGAQSGLWLLPAGGGAAREVARLRGPSGPLLIDPTNDDVYYAEQSDRFPVPPGAVRLLRFPGRRVRAALAPGATPLTLADAQLVAGGLDGAYDLVRDDRGALYVSSPNDGGVLRIDAQTGTRARLIPPQPGVGSLDLAFVDGGAGTFDPWQPRGGAQLLVAESDWTRFNTVRAITPARPTLTSTTGSTVPPGTLGLRSRGLPAGTPFWLLLTDRDPVTPRVVLHQPGGVPLLSALDLLIPPLFAATTAGPGGNAALDLPYPGGLHWSLAVQGIARAPDGTLRSSDLLLLQLQP